MASNVQPVFPRLPIIGTGNVTAANANYDGTGTVVTLVTAGADGTRIDSLTVKANGTQGATVIRVFVHNGTNAYLLTELTIASTTAIQTAGLSNNVIYFDGINNPQLVLPSGYSLRVSTGITGNWTVIATGGSYTA